MALNRLNKDFSYTGTPGAETSDYYDFEEDTATDKYAPFKNVVIQNTGTTSLRVYRNNQAGYRLLQKGVILELNDQEITFLRIYNESSTTAGAYTLELNNDYSEKEYLKEIANQIGTGVL